MSFQEQVTAAVEAVRDHPGIDHLWLNAFSCISPTDEFAAQVGRSVIRKVRQNPQRHIVLRINAS